ncbi:formylglycine-generating enzyme required for sulfatase activity [Paenibacillus phyllosphaerae]|uniref:Formylglycine-generating enzyme required for sulfatase activity n=1 Tax=Paenibacillus phyllosphaerae TaxID=274593 RepID=A0A7W5AZM3_9BACL|nr:SUMF1/EgtB/PvdO family nonheme iron enzyme [Paenibacillus phyllosphaerae]MBB3111712.1 formylglycine-generating enzyme required for sulfatase activity [Paenibacillus phyllosphaerae]
MRVRYVVLIAASLFVVSGCSVDKADNIQPQPAVNDDQFVLVQGGTFKNTASSYYGDAVTMPDFYIGKYEVTQQEWSSVMGSNPSEFQGDNLPVDMVSWYDAIEYCNGRSMKEGLDPYYNIDKQAKDPNNHSKFDVIKWTVSINAEANGYRLPTEAEWEYAAGGGQLSSNYAYSGSNLADEVAWYWRNAGDKYLSGEWNWPIIENNHNQTQPVGSKKPNELGLFDMSGNVREWCWNWYSETENNSTGGSLRMLKGGGWMGDASSAAIAYRGKFEASGIGPDQGFRIVRSE